MADQTALPHSHLPAHHKQFLSLGTYSVSGTNPMHAMVQIPKLVEYPRIHHGCPTIADNPAGTNAYPDKAAIWVNEPHVPESPRLIDLH